jgi:alpha/beta superfamily hydrolase
VGRAPEKESLMISGPVGQLEALLEKQSVKPINRVAILCHPHPQFEGTMHNKVVHTLARAMNDLDVAALRFNFRGVGGSEGSYADGDGEIDDVVAVAAYARERWPGAELWLAGFSFGAVVAARAAVALQPARLISIAPAVNILGKQLAEQPTMPWLIIQGDADDVVPPADVIEWVAGLQSGPQLIVLPEVGHFFHGHLVELRQQLVAVLA